MNCRKHIGRSVTAAAAGVAALACGTAGADVVVPLPGAEKVQTLSDGTVVTVRLVGESVTINPSLGGTPLHRNAWVSGSAQVEVAGAGDRPGGKLIPGYTVGCQVDISGGAVEGGVEGGANWSNGQNVRPNVGAETGGALSLGPGQTRSFYLMDVEVPDDFGNEDHKPVNRFRGNTGSVTWADSTIALNGCAGYAQARAFIRVEIETANVASHLTVWGAPFSLG
ncbi:MspA family porin [Nocardia lijiangensis]|uniref:MspA family porin n=1 Tax=Nocardia lijiangensis TaxID=299618 RepID=UPI00082E60EB|nr:MspA family porin [Nocardia lijiangensis]